MERLLPFYALGEKKYPLLGVVFATLFNSMVLAAYAAATTFAVKVVL